MKLSELVRTREFRIFLTFFVMFAFFSQWIGWDDDSRLDLTRSIVDRGTLYIDGYQNNTSDRAFYMGHYYSDKAPGASILAVPPYAALRLFFLPFGPQLDTGHTMTHVGSAVIYEAQAMSALSLFSMMAAVVFVSSLLSALSVIIIYRFSGHLTRKEGYRIMAAAAYGVGTMAFFYSTVFLGHGPAAFFSLLSFYILFKLKHRRVLDRNHLLAAGLAAGFAVVVEYSHIIILFLLAAYLLSFRKRALPLFLAACLVGAAPLLAYNAAISGNPLELTYFHLDSEIWGSTISSVEAGQGISIEPGPGFILWVLLGQFRPDSIGYHLNIMFRMTFGLYRGLFVYSPILLLGLYGMVLSRKRYRAEVWLSAACLVAFLWLAGTPGFEWWGGAFFGPRHLMAVLPFLFFPFMAAMESMDRRLIAALLVVSVAISFSGMQHTEDLYGKGSLEMNDVHSAMMMSSLAPLDNPLGRHYIPLTLRNGPRSRLFEGVVGGRLPDIRSFQNMQGVPFGNLALLPLLAFIALVWRRELRPVVGKVIKLLPND